MDVPVLPLALQAGDDALRKGEGGKGKGASQSVLDAASSGLAVDSGASPVKAAFKERGAAASYVLDVPSTAAVCSLRRRQAERVT